MKVTQKQMWPHLLRVRVGPKKTDRQPDKISVFLWRRLKLQQQFQLAPSPQAKPEVQVLE